LIPEVNGQLHAPAPSPLRSPVPSEYVGGWIPEPVWTLQRREKSRAPAGIPILDCQACSVVATMTMLSQLHLLVQRKI
jgi:hypothetical protein